MALMRIHDANIINYIESKNYYPVYETDDAAYFERSKQLARIIEDGYIENVLFYNRHR